MSSTMSALAALGGGAARIAPYRFADRCRESRPLESSTRRASRSESTTGRCEEREARREPVDVIAAASPRGAESRGNRHQHVVAVGIDGMAEQLCQRPGEIAPAALLVRQQRRADRRVVGSRGNDGQAGDHGRAQLRRDAAAAHRHARSSAAEAASREHQIDQLGRNPAGRHRSMITGRRRAAGATSTLWTGKAVVDGRRAVAATPGRPGWCRELHRSSGSRRGSPTNPRVAPTRSCPPKPTPTGSQRRRSSPGPAAGW